MCPLKKNELSLDSTSPSSYAPFVSFPLLLNVFKELATFAVSIPSDLILSESSFYLQCSVKTVLIKSQKSFTLLNPAFNCQSLSWLTSNIWQSWLFYSLCDFLAISQLAGGLVFFLPCCLNLLSLLCWSLHLPNAYILESQRPPRTSYLVISTHYTSLVFFFLSRDFTYCLHAINPQCYYNPSLDLSLQLQNRICKWTSSSHLKLMSQTVPLIYHPYLLYLQPFTSQ